MRKQGKFVVAALLLALGAAILLPNSFAKKIGVKEVPERVLAAAIEAVPGFHLTAAETEREKGKLVYELHGRNSIDGLSYEIEISAEGEVLEIEGSEEDDDHESDDEDD